MTTSYKDTIENVLQIISDLRGESSLNSNASRIRAISRAERDVAKRKFWRLFLLREQNAGTGDGLTTSFSIGTTTYNAREKGVCEVYVGGTTEDKRHTIVDHTNFRNIYNQNNAARIAYQWYDAANDSYKITINPVPSVGDVIYYSHFWMPASKTATSDAVYCFDMKILAYLANADIYESEEEPEMSLDSLQKAEALISTYEGIEEAPAVNQIYQVGNIESSIRPRGIGSY